LQKIVKNSFIDEKVPKKYEIPITYGRRKKDAATKEKN
jgi:hypothetical protein